MSEKKTNPEVEEETKEMTQSQEEKLTVRERYDKLSKPTKIILKVLVAGVVLGAVAGGVALVKTLTGGSVDVPAIEAGDQVLPVEE